MSRRHGYDLEGYARAQLKETAQFYRSLSYLANCSRSQGSVWYDHTRPSLRVRHYTPNSHTFLRVYLLLDRRSATSVPASPLPAKHQQAQGGERDS